MGGDGDGGVTFGYIFSAVSKQGVVTTGAAAKNVGLDDDVGMLTK